LAPQADETTRTKFPRSFAYGLIFDDNCGPAVETPITSVPEAAIPAAVVPIAVMPVRVMVIGRIRFGFLRQR